MVFIAVPLQDCCLCKIDDDVLSGWWKCDGEGELSLEKYIVCINVVGRVARGIARLTWDAVLQSNLRVKRLSRNTSLDRMAWRDATSLIRLSYA